MADSTTPQAPFPDDMHWAFSFLRDELQNLKQELRDFRKDVAGENRDLRTEIRHSMIVNMGYTTILIGLLAAFLQYRLPAG